VNLEKKGCETIILALKNSKVSTLNISNNAIGKSSVVNLSQYLSTNSTLTSLGLRHSNTMGNSALITLFKSLKANTGLKRLDIAFNAVSSDVAKAIADTLAVNQTLKEISLAVAEIGPDGAKYVADGIRKK